MRSFKKDEIRTNRYGKFCPHCLSFRTVKYFKYPPLDPTSYFAKKSYELFGHNKYKCLDCSEIFRVEPLIPTKIKLKLRVSA